MRLMQLAERPHDLQLTVPTCLPPPAPVRNSAPDYFTTRIDPEKETRRLVAKLQALGRTVAAAPGFR
jgi:hypothetical protein